MRQVRAISGTSEWEAWHVIPYAEGLHYCLLWWQDKVSETLRFDSICCVIGGGKPRCIEILTMDGAAGEVLV